MLCLGIETSCDETAAAVVEGGKKILSNVVASSLNLHRKYGGIVPEIATRYHVEAINYVLTKSLKQARVNFKDIKLIAVTYGPGLVGALLIGVTQAKTLSFSLGVPLIGINHLKAHLYSGFMDSQTLVFPFIGMVISGGHTCLVYVKNLLNWQILGQTIDDACGEAFDKVAKILGLGYPGGPEIETQAKFSNNNEKIKFPLPCLKGRSLDFSFSGIKTAVLYYVRENSKSKKVKKPLIRKVAKSFQDTAIEGLLQKALAACRLKNSNILVIGGGVSINQALREKFKYECKRNNIKLIFPSKNLCLDNAAMVAGLGYHLYRRGKRSDLTLTAVPDLGMR